MAPVDHNSSPCKLFVPERALLLCFVSNTTFGRVKTTPAATIVTLRDENVIVERERERLSLTLAHWRSRRNPKEKLMSLSYQPLSRQRWLISSLLSSWREYGLSREFEMRALRFSRWCTPKLIWMSLGVYFFLAVTRICILGAVSASALDAKTHSCMSNPRTEEERVLVIYSILISPFSLVEYIIICIFFSKHASGFILVARKFYEDGLSCTKHPQACVGF